jgi:hypothetical protein
MAARRFPEATDAYLALLKLNPEDYNYHRGYQCALLQDASHFHADGGMDLPIHHASGCAAAGVPPLPAPPPPQLPTPTAATAAEGGGGATGAPALPTLTHGDATGVVAADGNGGGGAAADGGGVRGGGGPLTTEQRSLLSSRYVLPEPTIQCIDQPFDSDCRASVGLH